MKTFFSRIAHIFFMICGVGGILLTESCSNGSVNKFSTSALDFQLDTLPELVAEDIWYPTDSIFASSYRVFSDTILLVENKRHDGPFVEIYNLKDSTQLNTFLNHGSGPGEVTFINIYPHGKQLQIIDPNRNQFADLDISRLGTLDSISFITYPQNQIIVPSINHLNGQLFTQNLFHFTSENHNINQPGSRFVTLSSDENYPSLDSYDYQTLNVGQGHIAVKPDEQKVWFVSRDSSRIEIYNPRLQLEKVITGPVDLGEPKYQILTTDGIKQKEVVYSGDKYETYYDCVYDDNRVVLLYYGQKWNPFKNAIEALPSYIFVMDWDGNLQGAYKAPSHLFNISLSKDSNVFYATIADEDDNPKPVKLTIR